MRILRTPDERFRDLPEYPWQPRYTEVSGVRIHHVEDGPADADPVLMLHGEPTWSYLYRRIVPVLAAVGHRAVAPDLVGFGRSDKPADRGDHTYGRHVQWMKEWMAALDLRRTTLVCQDWGSLIGLRLVAEVPERFARVVVANGFLPTGDQRTPWPFRAWQLFGGYSPWLPVGRIVQVASVRRLPREVVAAYDAPFPDDSYKAGAHAFPLLVPTTPDDPATPANRRAWEALGAWDRPFLTVFGERDPIFQGLDGVLQRHVPGAAGQPHTVLEEAGHMIQEDAGEELAAKVVDFIRSNA